MEYKVVPFTATLNQKQETIGAVAEQLERIITLANNQGWAYVRLESVSTYVKPSYGCFGFGAHAGYMSSYQMIVFSRG
jgi:hypothetical protein